MAEARSRDEWTRTSALMALLANCHRDPARSRSFQARDFDPYAKRSARARADITMLKTLFVDNRKRKEEER